MQKGIIFIAITIIWTISACTKTDDSPADDITYTKINKTITLSNADSIDGACKKLIFEIIKTRQAEKTSIIKVNKESLVCDAFSNIVTIPGNNSASVLNENQEISDNDNWKSVNGICLDEFAGKGEKYIGFREGFYPSGVTNYHYGWIRIELSADKSILKIIDRATNNTENKFIKAGLTK